MNRVLLTGRLTRDPEMRSLPSGKAVTNVADVHQGLQAVRPLTRRAKRR